MKVVDIAEAGQGTTKRAWDMVKNVTSRVGDINIPGTSAGAATAAPAAPAYTATPASAKWTTTGAGPELPRTVPNLTTSPGAAPTAAQPVQANLSNARAAISGPHTTDVRNLLPSRETIAKVGGKAGSSLPSIARGAGVGALAEGAVRGFTTTNDEYAQRMGIDAPESNTGGLALRTAGVASDIGAAAINAPGNLAMLVPNILTHGVNVGNYDSLYDVRNTFADVQAANASSPKSSQGMRVPQAAATAPVATAPAAAPATATPPTFEQEVEGRATQLGAQRELALLAQSDLADAQAKTMALAPIGNRASAVDAIINPMRMAAHTQQEQAALKRAVGRYGMLSKENAQADEVGLKMLDIGSKRGVTALAAERAASDDMAKDNEEYFKRGAGVTMDGKDNPVHDIANENSMRGMAAATGVKVRDMGPEDLAAVTLDASIAKLAHDKHKDHWDLNPFSEKRSRGQVNHPKMITPTGTYKGIANLGGLVGGDIYETEAGTIKASDLSKPQLERIQKLSTGTAMAEAMARAKAKKKANEGK